MEFEWLLSCLIYIVLSNAVVAILPGSLWNGGSRSFADPGLGLNSSESVNSVGDTFGGVSVLYKLATFMFAPWVIAGLPGLLATFLFIVNIASVAIPIIWLYDKLRGIR